MSYILSIDAGTTGVTVLLINKQIEVIAKAYAELQQYYPQPGWVEHDPEELILKTKQLIRKITEPISPKEIAAIGITNQRETVVVWDKKTGKPVHPAIVWQCRRTTERCHALKTEGYEKIIKEKTGLVCDPYFSATKIEWILNHVGGNIEDLLCGTIDSWLVWNLTREKVHVTDMSNASRTMLFNIHTKQWDEELLRLFSVDKTLLPVVKESSEIYGHMEIDGLQIPFAGIAGDQQAALFGQCCFSSGQLKNTYGTGCFLLLNTGEKAVLSQNLLTTIAWTINQKTSYALEGSVFIAGAAVQWLRDGLKIITSAEETAVLADSLKENDGVYFVPALSGLGCPYWDPDARGMLIGLTRGTTPAHIVRATLESIAYQTKDIVETMQKEAGISVVTLKADGGAAANSFLLQFQADILDAQVVVPKNRETTALGAAFLAGLAVGFWKDQNEIQQYWQQEKEFVSTMPFEKREKLYNKWKDAVGRSKKWNTHS
ncbi:glycerol kinase GlpK [Candidatus Woesearchaeota archaeon]|nr:glycerol kinase GlpK [Candidatus Woesearchaeota archaeon]